MSNEATMFWNRKSDEWARRTNDPGSFYTRRSRMVAGLAAQAAPGGSILDVGCGTGQLCREMAARGLDVYGTDISATMVEKAIELADGVIDDAGLRFQVSAPGSIRFIRMFNVITAIGVFPYVPDYDAFLEMLLSRLAPGGILIASNTNRLSIYTLRMLLDHAKKFSRSQAWRQVLGNILRTGVWSGGYVDYATARQCYNASDFEAMLAQHGLTVFDTLDLFNIEAMGLDQDPMRRGEFGRWLARRFGWCHIVVAGRAPAAAPVTTSIAAQALQAS